VRRISSSGVSDNAASLLSRMSSRNGSEIVSLKPDSDACNTALKRCSSSVFNLLAIISGR
jgi:hypothetical protein